MIYGKTNDVKDPVECIKQFFTLKPRLHRAPAMREYAGRTIVENVFICAAFATCVLFCFPSCGDKVMRALTEAGIVTQLGSSEVWSLLHEI